MPVKPSADPLVFTWNTIKAMDNVVESLLPDVGLMRFMPEDRMLPVVEGERFLLFDIGGRQRWVTEDSSQQQSPVLPGAHLSPPSCPPPLLPFLCWEVIVVVVAFGVVVVAL